MGVFLAVVSLLVGLGAVLDLQPVLAGEIDDEAAFVARINELRSEQGLAPLAVDTELVSASRSWAVQLSSNGVLSHAADLSVGVTSEWDKLGENVGVANTDQFDQLFNAFVNSPAHYANLVDPSFTHIGTGVVYDSNGRMWTTHRFMDKVEPTTTSTTTPGPTTSVSTPVATPTTVPASTSPTTPPPSTPAETGPGSSTSTTPSTTGTDAATEVPARSTLPPSGTSAEFPVLQPIPAAPLDPKVLTKLFADLAS